VDFVKRLAAKRLVEINMAFVYPIRDPTDIALALIANNEFNSRILKQANRYFDEYEHQHVLKGLYVAPFCFVKFLPKWRSWDTVEGYLVFTPINPWLTDLHQHVRDDMKFSRSRMVPDIHNSVENFLTPLLRADETDLFTFTEGGYYANAKDLERNDLYEETMKVTCAAMVRSIPVAEMATLVVVVRNDLFVQFSFTNTYFSLLLLGRGCPC
jgi:hypothetical protein